MSPPKPRRPDLPLRLHEREANLRLSMELLVKTFPGTGLAILAFDLEGGDEIHMSYISNARREDMIKTLREQADRLEAGLGDTAGKEVCDK